MSFTRKIKRNGRIYLAEVENQWINGKCVQKHLRYVGKEADGRTILASSLSNVQVEEVKLYGPLLILDHLAKEIGLCEIIGKHGAEILSMVYANCLDYKSINQMERWYERTDLSMLLDLDNVTERRLLDAMDSIESCDFQELQRRIFQRVVKRFKIDVTGIVYDVTNTYLYGKRCPYGKYGHDRDAIKGRPLIQIGLAVTKDSGIPLCHKVLDGNIHDARLFNDFITELRPFHLTQGLLIYDRGIASAENIRQTKSLHWDVLCGLPIKGGLAQKVRSLISGNEFIRLNNRVRLRKGSFYVITVPYSMNTVKGTLALCFNDNQRHLLRESRYDEIAHTQQLLLKRKAIKAGLEKYFSSSAAICEEELLAAEEFDGYLCIFTTAKLNKDEIVHLYFEKDLIEKAFRTIKGITRLQPVRHWLYNRVIAHVFICYLSYLLFSLLQYRLRKLNITAQEALLELDSMYKVYLRDSTKDFRIWRVVTLSKKQEAILKAVDQNLLKLKHSV